MTAPSSPPSSGFELANRVAVVTGSSSGVGRAVALQLAAAGADVVVHCRANLAGAQAVAADVQALGRRSLVLAADLADAAALDGLVEQAWNWRGRVDIWVNNAGADVLTGDARDWSFARKLEYLWQVDVRGAIELTRRVGARMTRQDGGPGEAVIVNVGWDQAEQGMAGDSGEMFAAIKGAVMAFTRSAAQSLAPRVRVNCVAPGWIRTAWGEQAAEYWQQRAAAEALLDRWGEAEDVARAVHFLVSPAASFITGAILPVNGGRRR
jgi:3-oxoacyl-[acyl-carrier protein] reductase